MSENKPVKQERNRRGQFVKGHSGNPTGLSPEKSLAEIWDEKWAQALEHCNTEVKLENVIVLQQ